MHKKTFKSRLYNRVDWLNPQHPVARRDDQHIPAVTPRLIQRISAAWTLVGYSALVHGLFFVLAIITYNHPNPSFTDALMPIFSPFLTPFGTPLVMAFFQSIMYWSLLIGIGGQVAHNLGRELESGTWGILRLTPYPTLQLGLIKVVGAVRQWSGVLRTIMLVRLLALVLIPLALASNRARDMGGLSANDFATIGIFLAQPYAEMFCMLGIGALVATLAQGINWTRLYTLSTGLALIGGMSLIMALWMAFTSPIGGLAGLFTPFSHWMPLLGALFPPEGDLYTAQTLLFGVAFLIIPAFVGGLCLALGLFRLQRGMGSAAV